MHSHDEHGNPFLRSMAGQSALCSAAPCRRSASGIRQRGSESFRHGSLAIEGRDGCCPRLGGRKRLSPVGRELRNLRIMELEDENCTPVDTVSVVHVRFDHREIAARHDPADARPSREPSIDSAPALTSDDALSRLGELDHRVLLKPPVEPLEILVDQRLKQPLDGPAVRSLSHVLHLPPSLPRSASSEHVHLVKPGLGGFARRLAVTRPEIGPTDMPMARGPSSATAWIRPPDGARAGACDFFTVETVLLKTLYLHIPCPLPIDELERISLEVAARNYSPVGTDLWVTQRMTAGPALPFPSWSTP